MLPWIRSGLTSWYLSWPVIIPSHFTCIITCLYMYCLSLNFNNFIFKVKINHSFLKKKNTINTTFSPFQFQLEFHHLIHIPIFSWPWLVFTKCKPIHKVCACTFANIFYSTSTTLLIAPAEQQELKTNKNGSQYKTIHAFFWSEKTFFFFLLAWVTN